MSLEDGAVQPLSYWGLPPDAIVGAANGRVAAVHWRHTLNEIESPGVHPSALVYMLSDSASALRCGQRRYDASAHRGGLGLIPAGLQGHWTFSGAVHHCLHLYLPDSLLDYIAVGEGLPLAPALDLRLKLDDPLLAALMREVQAAMVEAERSALYLDTLGTTIAMRVIRCHSDRAHRAPRPAAGGLAPWQVKRIASYIEERLADDITLDELTGVVGLSAFHLCRAFKVSTGLPPHRWQLARRIERARQLLETTDRSIGDIAAAVGYDDPSQFAAVFRKALDVSPSRYRRERRS